MTIVRYEFIYAETDKNSTLKPELMTRTFVQKNLAVNNFSCLFAIALCIQNYRE